MKIKGLRLKGGVVAKGAELTTVRGSSADWKRFLWTEYEKVTVGG
jgi:hypothetical protein